MASLNKVFLIGNVGKDPEIRQFNDGGQICNFSLATTEVFTDREGQRQEQSEWHNIVLKNKLANIAQYIHKGSRLYIEGRISSRSWATQDGQKRYTTEIIASSLQLLDSKPQQPSQPAPSKPVAPARPSRPAPPVPAPPPTIEDTANWGDDDFPF